jgi:two-component system, OmpR family, response regulator
MDMAEKKHILVVDDDREIGSLLSDFLSNYNYQVSVVYDGKSLFEALDKHPNEYDLIILDIMMPNINGLEACQRIRQTSNIPIIMLTAVSEETDRIVGLECGADDYMAKPFSPRELLARIKAIFRRISGKAEERGADEHLKHIPIYEFAGWRLDTAERSLISPENTEVSLTGAGYDLLLVFIEHPQHVLSRDQLMEYTRHRQADPYDRSIDVQVSRLRQKIENDPKNPSLIKTVRAGGYIFTPKVQRVR